MRGERGQATVEWLGLVLVAGLVLGGLAAVRAPADDRGLGDVVAKRITCAAGGACADRRMPGGRAAARPGAPVSRARTVDAFRRLRAVGTVARRLWIVCLGYRRFRYKMEHPRAPTEVMPLREALDIANTCLNPVQFLEEG